MNEIFPMIKAAQTINSKIPQSGETLKFLSMVVILGVIPLEVIEDNVKHLCSWINPTTACPSVNSFFQSCIKLDKLRYDFCLDLLQHTGPYPLY